MRKPWSRIILVSCLSLWLLFPPAFAQTIVNDPGAYIKMMEQTEQMVRMLDQVQKQLAEAKKTTDTLLSTKESIEAMRGTMYHYYNNAFGVIGEAYRTYEAFQNLTNPNDYTKILDEFRSNMDCLRADMTAMTKVETLFKTRYQFDASTAIENSKNRAKNLFFTPDNGAPEYLAPYRNPSLEDQNLSTCGGVVSYAKIKERKLQKLEALMKSMDPEFKRQQLQAAGITTLPTEDYMELRYKSIMQNSSCPDNDQSKCDGAKLKLEEIGAADTAEVRQMKESRNKVIQALNEKGAKTPASIAEDQLFVQMYMLEHLKRIETMLRYSFDKMTETDHDLAQADLEDSYKKNLYLLGSVDGVSVEEAKARDAEARNLKLTDFNTFKR